jgi:hypothetical protein
LRLDAPDRVVTLLAGARATTGIGADARFTLPSGDRSRRRRRHRRDPPWRPMALLMSGG